MQKKTVKILLAGAVVLAVLAAAFYFGGGPAGRGWSTGERDQTISDVPQSGETDPAGGEAEEKTPAAAEETPDAENGSQTAPEEEGGQTAPPAAETPEQPETGGEKDAWQTDPVPEGKPKPVEPQDQQEGSGTITVTVSISCATILDHMDWCDEDKRELVPEDGWILRAEEVEATEGESAFDLLQRVCRDKKIHMEFSMTPIYNSAYIEGIGNLYEFDVGKESGWMFRVNGWFPNYGCSRYALQDGDTVEWVYTCDLGKDVGGGQIVQTEG